MGLAITIKTNFLRIREKWREIYKKAPTQLFVARIAFIEISIILAMIVPSLLNGSQNILLMNTITKVITGLIFFVFTPVTFVFIGICLADIYYVVVHDRESFLF